MDDPGMPGCCKTAGGEGGMQRCVRHKRCTKAAAGQPLVAVHCGQQQHLNNNDNDHHHHQEHTHDRRVKAVTYNMAYRRDCAGNRRFRMSHHARRRFRVEQNGIPCVVRWRARGNLVALEIIPQQ